MSDASESDLGAQVSLREINADTARAIMALTVADDQHGFVAPNAVSLGQALFAPEAWYRAIYVGDKPAGFVMLYDESLRKEPPAKPEVGVWRLMVDQKFQRRGVGRAAMGKLIEHVRAKGCFEKLELSYVPGVGSPEPFYRGLGFRPDGRVDDGEVVMVLPLRGESRVESRLRELGLVLPPPLQPPPGVVLPFSVVRVVGRRALISGHGPQAADGTLAPPFGKVGADVTPEQGYASARLTALSVLASLQRAIGNLDRIVAWTRVFGMVNAASGFTALPGVINGFSDLVLDVFGAEIGAHSRSAIGVAELPFGIPVEVEAEVELA